MDAGVRGFEHWMAQRRSVPLIQALQHRAEHWAEIEMRRARRRLARGQDVEAVLQSLTRGLTGKLMHGALHEIRASDEAQRRHTAETMSRLFGLAPVVPSPSLDSSPRPAPAAPSSSPSACPHGQAHDDASAHRFQHPAQEAP